MLSAFIQSILSYSAVPLVRQLIHHWYVHPGPLVLRTALFKYLTPAIDKDELSHDVLNPARVPL